jgi:putative ABC transport system ATP-binding protein
MLSVKNLSKDYQSGDQIVHAVKNVSLDVPKGSFATIVGKSGSGKSTLLALLGALDSPSDGQITVKNDSVANLSGKALTAYRRDRIGFVFQAYNLVPNLTAIENVCLPMEFSGRPKAERVTRAAELLTEVGLDEGKQHRKPPRLSGGEQQRVAIARALANQPQLILADEPTGNLDTQTGAVIIRLLKQLAKKEQVTILVVTHDPSLTKLADHSFRMQDGTLQNVSRRKNG